MKYSLKDFTIKDLEAMRPCMDAMEFARKHRTLSQAWQKCERADWMMWFLRRKSLLEKPDLVKLACVFAKRVLPIFEKKYPKDFRPRKAIEAALEWLRNPTEENRKASAAASASAYAAADAAYASSSASASAYAAADAAADASAAAADASAYAAAAYAYAASASASADAKNKEQKWHANQVRKLIPNPFK